MTHKMIEVTTHDVTPTWGGLLHHSTCWCKQPDPDAVTITISRATAESVVRDLPEASADFAFGRVALACQAALEGER